MSTGYKIDDQEGVYYLTLQVVRWIDVFTRKEYKDIIIENLRYCQQNKELIIFAYVIMSNHIHLMAQSKNANLSNTIRDFKSFNSKVIIDTIEKGRESRKDWILEYFKSTARTNERSSEYQFWTHENHAEQIFTDKFVRQKLDYIHMNPVRAGLVRRPEDYIYSSASNYAGLESVLEVEILTTKWKSY